MGPLIPPILALSFDPILGRLTALLNNAYAIGLTVLGVGFVIFIHELGHFVVAKWAGTKVEMFSLGFGPTLVSWRKGFGLRRGSTVRDYEAKLKSAETEAEADSVRAKYGETEYSVRVLPLGGFVKILGMEPGEDDVAPDEPRAYFNRPVGARMAIISAGVVMNAIFGILCATWVHMRGVRETPAVVGSVIAGQPAYEAGLRPGDEIVAIDGRNDISFKELSIASQLSGAGQKLHLDVKRPGRKDLVRLEIEPKKLGKATIPTIGMGPSRSLDLYGLLPLLPHEGQAGAGREPSAASILGAYAAVVADPDKDLYDHIVAASPESAAPSPVSTIDELDTLLVRERARPVRIVAERGPADDEKRTQASLERVETIVPPRLFRDFGMRMTAGPIVAIRPDSPASRAGFRTGDRIVSIDGQAELDPMRLPDVIAKRAGKSIPVVVRRGEAGKYETLTVIPDSSPIWVERSQGIEPLEVPGLGLALAIDPKVAAVTPGSPADRAKVAVGDVVKSIRFLEEPPKAPGAEPSWSKPTLLDGKNGSWPSVFDDIQLGDGPTPLQFDFGKGKPIAMTPEPVADWFDPSHGLRFLPLDRMHPPEPLGIALRKGVRDAEDMATSVFRLFRNMATGRSGAENIGGPVPIFALSFQIAKSGGVGKLLPFLGLLSLNLAVLNLLPIPPLDGGRLVLLAAEKVRGRRLPEGATFYPMIVGFILLVLLIIAITIKDVWSFLPL